MSTEAAVTPANGPMVALLVDADRDTRSLYAEYLAFNHCIIDEAADGREALAKALALPHDIVITESRVPGIGGIELCRLLRRDRATISTPVLLVTADASPATFRRAHNAGADAVLVKPCLPDLLFDEMQKLVAHVRRARELVSRAAATKAWAQQEQERAVQAVERSRDERGTLSRAHLRMKTTEPPQTPPELFCPHCDRTLTYVHSHIGGVSARFSEQWDYFTCQGGCGTFQYRQRTRRLRHMV